MPQKLKIKYIERGEAWLDGGEVAVPIEITARDGVAEIEYYPSAKNILDEFVRLYGENEDTFFSREAIAFAAEKARRQGTVESVPEYTKSLGFEY